MLAEILYEGCSAAAHRIRLILLDIFWKGLWLATTAALSGVFLVWIGTEIGSVTLEGPDPRTNPLVLLSLLRELWEAYASHAFWGFVVLLFVSAIVWLFLEAYFRSRILPVMEWGQASKSGTVSNFLEESHRLGTSSRKLLTVPDLLACPHFMIFLASSIARNAILFGAVFLLAGITFGHYLTAPIGEWPRLWEDTRGVTIVAIVILIALVFLLTVADTLIRSDAVTLLATHLLEVAGLIGGLLIFEACIAGSAVIAVLISILHAATPIEFFLTLVFAALAVLVLTALHSYLLLVRFFSIGIMRRNVEV